MRKGRDGEKKTGGEKEKTDDYSGVIASSRPLELRMLVPKYFSNRCFLKVEIPGCVLSTMDLCYTTDRGLRNLSRYPPVPPRMGNQRTRRESLKLFLLMMIFDNL